MTMSGLAANRRPRVVVTSHLGSHTQWFTRVARVPNLTRKLQTGTMAFECVIGLPGTQGEQGRPSKPHLVNVLLLLLLYLDVTPHSTHGPSACDNSKDCKILSVSVLQPSQLSQ